MFFRLLVFALKTTQQECQVIYARQCVRMLFAQHRPAQPQCFLNDPERAKLLCAGINLDRLWKNCLLSIYLGNELILIDTKECSTELPILCETGDLATSLPSSYRRTNGGIRNKGRRSGLLLSMFSGPPASLPCLVTKHGRLAHRFIASR
jgi:hypothetical protein